MAEVAVLVMAYGTPASMEEVEAYYTHIRRGRPPGAHQLADLVRRYEAIGGVSPLHEITEAQAASLGDALNDGGQDAFTVRLGMKHAAPFIEDAAAQVRADRCVGLVLAPHAAAMSVGAYHERARASVPNGCEYVPIWAWWDHPGFVTFLTSQVTDAIAEVPLHARPHVVFTAHSLPSRIVEDGDDYPIQLRKTAEVISDRANLVSSSIAWQSAGSTAERWLGPDLLQVIDRLGDFDDVDSVIVCPCGFVSDHLEVLYDVDVEAREAASRAGLAFARTLMPNAAPEFIAALADIVRTAL